MEQSNEELLSGMQALKRGQQFSDELFCRIFEIEDVIDRTQYIETARSIARERGRLTEFNSLLKAFITDYQQRLREGGNRTAFTGQEMELECGSWLTNDSGVYTERFNARGMCSTRIMACSHPILPVMILKNVDNGDERVKLAYFKYGEWMSVTVNRDVCADNSSIVKVLSKIGIEVTSENAKYLVRYISDCIGLNPAKLVPVRAINRLGWSGSQFMPYASDIQYDGNHDFDTIYQNLGEAGDFEVWRSHCLELRKNQIVRMAFAASAASVLLELVNALPFVFHIWSGESGTGKTVALMAAMSLWGNPKMGGLVKTMNTTKVGIMRTSAFLYSIPYAGDELQTMKDKWNTNFDQLIYQITEGIDRGRGRASGGVEEVKTWHNSFLFTGEEPITKNDSREGSKNRVIEVEAEGKLIQNGNQTVSILTENYGFAGKILIRCLQGINRKDLQEEYKRYFDEICKLNTTEKQAMSMAAILLADRLLTDLIFSEETAYTVGEVKEYLRKSNEVDVGERSYSDTVNWIAENAARFRNPDDNQGAVWGRVDMEADPPVAIVNKKSLEEFLEKSGYDYAAVTKKWAKAGHILFNSQGKFVHQTKVYGWKASYIKIVLGQKKKDEFLTGDEIEQIKLPFD